MTTFWKIKPRMKRFKNCCKTCSLSETRRYRFVVGADCPGR